MNIDLTLRSRRVVLPAGIAPARVAISAGAIAAVLPWDAENEGGDFEDFGDLAILPGVVDTHVHINDPGRADWEGFESATRAAAAGGVTTLVDMPLNSIPATIDTVALAAKRRAAAGRLMVDVGFWGGVVPGNLVDLEPLHQAGVLGFKAFMVPSGVDEFASIDRTELLLAAREVARLGSVLLVHAEAPEPIAAATVAARAGDPRRHATWESSRPAAAEAQAIELLIEMTHQTGARIHVVHLSSAAGLERIRAAQARGEPISAESCPHYLTFAAEEIPDGATEFKCAPPIRGAAQRDELWAGLAEGSITLVASDHSPSPPELKQRGAGDFFTAWGGIASLQVALAATWTAAHARGHGLERVAEWMAAAPARLAGLEARKGAIVAGRDADILVFDPEAVLVVEPAKLYHRHPLTPYSGCELRGRVIRTYLRGRPVYREGRFDEPSAELLGR